MQVIFLKHDIRFIIKNQNLKIMEIQKLQLEEKLNSVNAIVNTETLMLTFLSTKKTIHIDDLSDSFFYRLDNYDLGTIQNLINDRVYEY